VDCRLEYRDWSNELAYALKAFLDSSDNWIGSEVVDECELCIEKRLDCELEGVRTFFELLKVTGDDCGLAEYWN